MSENAQQPFEVTVPHRSTYSTIVIGDITFKKLMSIRSLIHAIEFIDASAGEVGSGNRADGRFRVRDLRWRQLKKLVLGNKYDPARNLPCSQFRQHVVGLCQGPGRNLSTHFPSRRHFQ
jgi:hypothetical protein